MKQHETYAQRAATASGWPVWREGVNCQDQPVLVATLPHSEDLLPYLRELTRALQAKKDYTPPTLAFLPPHASEEAGNTVSLVITPPARSTLQQATTLLECWGPRKALWALCREAALHAAPALLLSLASIPLCENGFGLSLGDSFAVANQITLLSEQTQAYPTCGAMLADRHLDSKVKDVFSRLVPALAQPLPPLRPDPKMPLPVRACYA